MYSISKLELAIYLQLFRYEFLHIEIILSYL